MTQSFVLVIDPNPATHRRVSVALEGTGLGLIKARNAEEAEDRANGHDIALVLSATSLPKGNGYNLARALRERHPAAVVLLMAGGFEVYNKQRAAEAGVSGYVSKPFTSELLLAQVEAAIGPLGEAGSGDGALPPREEDGLEELSSSALAPIREAERAPEPVPAPPPSSERVATLLPRNYEEAPLVSVDPEVVGPALERAVLEVLPEVVEAVLRRSLDSSPTFRDLVEAAVAEILEERLDAIARRMVEARLDRIEAEASSKG